MIFFFLSGWTAACQVGRRLPADRYLEMHLEDVSAPLLEKALDFCELEREATLWAELEERFQPRLSGARSANADPETLERIRRWIEPTNRWLGYD